MANKHINAVVVGAGASGGVVAKELAVNGISVVLLERGGWPDYDKHINDELISQRSQVLGVPFGPDPDKNPRVYININGTKEIVTPLTNGDKYNHIAACVGSGTVSYGAMAWRYMEEDFKMKSVYGHVEGSTLEDWPITYFDLEPYYEKAEWELGVAGDSSENPFAAPRKKDYPMPPFEYNSECKALETAAKKLGLHPFPIPMLRNSIPYNNRPACIRNRTCVGFQCPVNAKNGTHNTVIPAALETGNCEVRTNCIVAEIMSDDRGRITGVRYYDENNREQIQTADFVVVAASATETARLLLNSKTKLFPKGLGNNNDWVGRNLQGHAYTSAFGLFDYDIKDLQGPGAAIAMCDYNHHNKGVIGGGLIVNEFSTLPYSFSGRRPPGMRKWGKEDKEFQVKNFRRLSGTRGPVQEMPVFNSRVTVDPGVKDFWGIPVAALSGQGHPLDYVHCRFMSLKGEEILKAAGAYKTWLSIGGRGDATNGGQHQCGTARMGNDPKTSVVNKNGRVHDIDNLFIADASVFVTNGAFNPVLTIMAVAYMISEQIVSSWKGTKFKS